MDILTVLLQQNTEQSPWSTVIMVALMFGVVYFFMIRPNAKKVKAQAAYRQQLKNGDKIITTGGIHGRISGMKDSFIIIELEGGGKMKIEKSAVSMEMTNALNAPKEKDSKEK